MCHIIHCHVERDAVISERNNMVNLTESAEQVVVYFAITLTRNTNDVLV